MPANVTISPTNTPWAPNPCTFYFVQIDSEGAPILGTMFSKYNNNLSDNQTPCTEVRLPATQMVAPAGKRQCFFPNGNRYFYQIDKITGLIVGNSMILVSGQGKPPMCVGTHQYLEYKNFTGQRTNYIN